MGIITYYVVKRAFCFLDEWLFYILSIYLYISGLYFPLIICLIAGIAMIYTSYKNLEYIEIAIADKNEFAFRSYSFFY